MWNPATELARRLAERAETVCRHYLSNGRRQGRYWSVGDVHNAKGRSLYVRLSGPGAAGKWTDAATGEHGDLLDLIRLNRGFVTLGEAMAEARAFLLLTPSSPQPVQVIARTDPPKTRAARRLFAAGRPIVGTPAEAYLHARGIASADWPVLRYHPAVYYRADDEAPLLRLPALLAAITDLDGSVAGVHRIWLDPDGLRLASIPAPKRTLGRHLGHGVRFGEAADTLVAGEGLETVLSLKIARPDLPMIAALTASHLAALTLPGTLERLWIARDDDAAGRNGALRLCERAETDAVAVGHLVPVYGDFNNDLRRLGAAAFAARLRHLLCNAPPGGVAEMYAASRDQDPVMREAGPSPSGPGGPRRGP